MGWAQTSDAFEANRNLGRGGRDVAPGEDPRTSWQKLRIRAKQEWCAEHGAPEALGNGVASNGDSTAWTKERCDRFRDAVEAGVVDPSGRSRKMADANKPLKLEEYGREDLIGSLVRLGVTPQVGTDTEELRATLRRKLAEFDAPKPALGPSAPIPTPATTPSPSIPASPLPPAATDATLPAPEDIAAMAWDEQRKIARRLGISTYGVQKPLLIERIVTALKAKQN